MRVYKCHDPVQAEGQDEEAGRGRKSGMHRRESIVRGRNRWRWGGGLDVPEDDDDPCFGIVESNDFWRQRKCVDVLVPEMPQALTSRTDVVHGLAEDSA